MHLVSSIISSIGDRVETVGVKKEIKNFVDYSGLFVRGSFKKFYLLLQNFVKPVMKCVTIVALCLSYTFMVNPI